ncbi:hypothetical protein [Microbacterium sp.]|uniref:FMN-binding protein n=1 Tax=Microbacterium sp. TaxID=51671 RepID=UPI0039E42D61
MTAVPRPVRVTAALAGVVGVVALAGCSSAADAEEDTVAATSTPTATASASASASSSASAASSTYVDGTYTAEASYQSPGGLEEVTVTVTLVDDIITDVEVTADAASTQSKQYQSEFIDGIAAVVVGKDIDEISVSKVSGSSLTSEGFNDAIAEIKTEAAA